VNRTTALVGLGSIALLFAFKRLSSKIPAALTDRGDCCSCQHDSGSPTAGSGRVVGDIASGLPTFEVPKAEPEQTPKPWFPGALSIVLLGYAESLASAKAATRMIGGQINPNQELVSLGLANFGSAINGGFVASRKSIEDLCCHVGGEPEPKSRR